MTESSKEGKGGLKGFIATLFFGKGWTFYKTLSYQRLKLPLFKYAELNSTQLNIDLQFGTLHIDIK